MLYEVITSKKGVFMNKIVLSLLLAASAVLGADAGMKIYGKTCVECHGDA